MPVRYRKARDRNHGELSSYAESLGMSVLDVSPLSGGLDLLVGCCGIDQRVEIKDGSKPPSARKITKGEQDVMRDWRGRKPVMWESKHDVEETRRRMLRDAELIGELKVMGAMT